MEEISEAKLDPAFDGQIARLQAEHNRYATRLEELIQKPYLSSEEQLEEVRLKKLKLHAKDLMRALATNPAGNQAPNPGYRPVAVA